MDLKDLKFELSEEGLEDAEIQILELAHEVSISKDQLVATHGRALKHLVPAWISFLREEIARDENNGPGNAIYALCRAFSFIIALSSLGTMRQEEAKDGIVKTLSDLFTHDVSLILEKGISYDPAKNESPTTH